MSETNRGSVEALSGYATALPTPFRDGTIDEVAFRAFCDWQISHGIAALVVNGTTGEAPTLSLAEQRRLIRIAVETAGARVPVIAGAGANATEHAVLLAQQSEAAGASGLLAVTPYYNRPPQEGLFQHFRAMHEATSLPILLYDVPARTGCTLAVDTVLRLAELPRIVGIKDATGELSRVRRWREALGDRFRLLSGDDATALDFFRAGGHGCISVLANVAPSQAVALYDAWRRGSQSAKVCARALLPLTAALFAESNPIPVKCALEAMGWMRADVRLPLWQAAPATRANVIAALAGLGLLRNGQPTAVLSMAAEL